MWPSAVCLRQRPSHFPCLRPIDTRQSVQRDVPREAIRDAEDAAKGNVGSGRTIVTGLRLNLACVLVLSAGLGGCASKLTFDVPYDRVVTELRELYPEGRMKRGGGRDGRRLRKRWNELARGAWSLNIRRDESSSPDQSMIHMEVGGGKYFWKREMDITIRGLSESRTAVTVRCDYLRLRLFGGYSRSRDRDYERKRVAEISERLAGPTGTPNASRRKKSVKGKSK